MSNLDFQKPNLYFRERDELAYPTRRAEKIEPNKTYRARNGERIQVYAIVDKEIHGAILHKGTWEIDTWHLSGGYLAEKGKEHERDIILSKPLTLKPGQKYKSRDGRPVRIFETNLGSKDFPVIGVIKEDQVWVPRVWNESGVTKRPYGPNNDIVAEWSEG